MKYKDRVIKPDLDSKHHEWKRKQQPISVDKDKFVVDTCSVEGVDLDNLPQLSYNIDEFEDSYRYSTLRSRSWKK